MAEKTRLEMQMEASAKKIQEEKNRYKQLGKQQAEKDRKDRNHRLCKRHGHLESLLPVTIEITDEQFYAFIDQHIANKHGIAALAALSGQTVETITVALTEAKAKAKAKKAGNPTPTAAGQKPDTQQPKNATPNAANPVNPQSATA